MRQLCNQHSCARYNCAQEHARDSFENLLFGLCRFHELTGAYPAHVTVVSYSLKKRRFVDLHRAALRWPANLFHFIGERSA